MKKIIENHPERFFVSKNDFISILNYINENAVKNGVEPIIFSGVEIDEMEYNSDYIKLSLFRGYYS